MNVYSNLAIFYQASPHFGGNRTNFVAGWQGWSRYASMIPNWVVVSPSYEIMLKFRWCSASFWSHTHVFWPDQPQNWSDFLKNGDWLGRKWRGWSRYSSVIPSWVVLNISCELILKFRWCSTRFWSYKHVFLAKPATKLVQFPQKWGLAW